MLIPLAVVVNPIGAECYGLSPSAIVSWIADFSNTYHAVTTWQESSPSLFKNRHLTLDQIPIVGGHPARATAPRLGLTMHFGSHTMHQASDPCWLAGGKTSSTVGILNN